MQLRFLMMATIPTTHAAMIKGWGGERHSTVAFLGALDRERERRRLRPVSIWTVRAWIQRDSIPSDMWASVVSAAESEGIAGITLEALAAAAEYKAAAEPPRQPQLRGVKGRAA